MDRLQAKLDILMKLGRLFGPMESLVERPSDFDEQERAEIYARYFSEYPQLHIEFKKFTTGQPGHNYQIEFQRFFDALDSVYQRLRQEHALEQVLRENVKAARDAVQAVPVPRSSVILEAGSPFTAFCRLRSLCEADAKYTLTWFDPYFGSSIFHRYLQFVDSSVSITLVASEPGPRAGRANTDRWNEFLDISRLFAAERGPATYRLVVAPTLHDRWLILDQKRIYAVGGSAKDAASKDIFTIASVDPTPANLRIVDDTVGTGVEWFGPTVDVHT